MSDPVKLLEQVFAEFGDFCQRRGRVSEADTRALIIDRIVHEVLEWPRSCVVREVYATPGYIDYELTTTRPVLVVEAKAAGESFVIPYRKSHVAARLKINGVLRSNQALQGALVQAQRYCSDRGMRYGVVTNGYSFVVFRALVDGSPWREGEAIVFATPKVLEEDFTTFWNLLSYEAVRAGRLDDSFRATASVSRGYHRPISRIVNADATYARNPINTALRPYVEKYFGDIASQDELEVLEHCYIHSQPLQIIDRDLSMIIQDGIPRFAAHAVQILTDEVDQGGPIEADLRRVLSQEPLPGTAILLMGGIGAGKTTFLRRFFTFVARDLVRSGGPAVLALINFLGAPELPDELDGFLWNRLNELLRNQDPVLTSRQALEEMCTAQIHLIRETFGGSGDCDLKIAEMLFAFGSDPQKFSQESIRYYLRRGRMPIVVFDNVDQLGVAAQTKIFTTAEWFANHLGCMSILVMREESYCVAQLRKQLTAYTIRPYHLSSPSFREMIRVRIDFATRHAASQRDSAPFDQSKQTHGNQLLDFFEVLRCSVFDRNKNIARLIEAVSFGNMRLALLLFNNFIISGATNTPEILERFRASGGYSVPFHQFAKSVVLGDYRYYKQSRSLVLNLFDLTEARNASHFSTLRILNFTAGNFGARKTPEGFIDLQVLVNAMVDEFDNEEDTLRTIGKLIELNRQLLELDTRRGDSLEGADSVRITSAGQYYVHYLANAFAYLDLVWHDTPLATLGICETLARAMPEVDMTKRFARVDVFLDYLDGQEQGELRGRNLPQSGSAFYGPFLPRIRAQYEREKAFIRKRFRQRDRSDDPQQDLSL